jgi:hypothetical protein
MNITFQINKGTYLILLIYTNICQNIIKTYPSGPSLHYPALGQFGRTQIKMALQDSN